MDLKLKDKNILIEGIALPKSLQISLEKRGKTVVNHRYEEDVKELQIYCSSCNHWHSVYRLEGKKWVDINQTYRLCNQGKSNEYFDTYCSDCYKQRGKSKCDTKINKKVTVGKDKGNAKDRIQQTVFLTEDNDMYIKLYSVLYNKRKNQLINDIIAEFKKNHPINL